MMSNYFGPMIPGQEYRPYGWAEDAGDELTRMRNKIQQMQMQGANPMQIQAYQNALAQKEAEAKRRAMSVMALRDKEMRNMPDSYRGVGKNVRPSSTPNQAKANYASDSSMLYQMLMSLLGGGGGGGMPGGGYGGIGA